MGANVNLQVKYPSDRTDEKLHKLRDVRSKLLRPPIRDRAWIVPHFLKKMGKVANAVCPYGDTIEDDTHYIFYECT